MPETPRTWTLKLQGLYLVASPYRPEDAGIEVVEKAPVDAERERMLGLIERYVDLIERYGAAIIEISNALATNVSDKGRVMRARTVIAGLAPDVKQDSREHGRLTAGGADG